MSRPSSASPPQRPLTDLLSSKSTGPNRWESNHAPERAGNAADIAYGGFAIAAAAQAACKAAPPNYHLYTIMGNFLGPAFCDRRLIATTRTIRQTRTFFTVQVEVLQTVTSKSGEETKEERPCLIALADFQTQEAGSLLTYSSPPKHSYTTWDRCPDVHSYNAELVKEGTVTQRMVDAQTESFGLFMSYLHWRFCPESVFAQNLAGIAKHVVTTQDTLPITDKTSAEWVACRTALPDQAANIAAVAWVMDASLSFAPLSFSHMFLDDAAACSSLDFALRVFSNNVDLEQWCLRELSTVTGAEGRTYSEARLWDEEGNMMACMTQQGIMRRKADSKSKEKL